MKVKVSEEKNGTYANLLEMFVSILVLFFHNFSCLGTYVYAHLDTPPNTDTHTFSYSPSNYFIVDVVFHHVHFQGQTLSYYAFATKNVQ